MLIQHRPRAALVAVVAVGLAAAATTPVATAAPRGKTGDVPMGRVADLRPGPPGSDPSRITPFAGGVYFVADDGVHGSRVWRSDGTAAGTAMVSATVPATTASELVVVGSTLFFSSGDQLWASDGTAAGTRLVRDVAQAVDAPLEQLTAAGSLVWFTADDGVSGRELWRSDGTEAGTVRLTDRPPGADSNPLAELTAVGSSLWFTGGDGTDIVSEVWRSDGTPGGTAPLTKFRTFFDTYPAELTPAGDHVYFVLGGGSDGRNIFRIPTGGAASEEVYGSAGNYVTEVVADGDSIWFADTAYSDPSPTSWVSVIGRSDGTPAGTTRVAELGGERTSEDLTVVGHTLYFTHDDHRYGPELWRTDGTKGGTRRLTALPGKAQDTRPTELVAGSGRLWFVADAGRGRELWVSDGTSRGTHPVDDTRRGRAGSHPAGLAVSGDQVFMSLDDGVAGRELWATRVDGAVSRGRVVTPRAERVGPGSWFVRARAGAHEWVESSARGRVGLPGVRRPVVLERARVTSYADRTEVLRLALPRRYRATVLRAISRYRDARGAAKARATVKAKVIVTLRDSSGNTKRVVRTIRLS